jgi:glycosyltransferase involved in cell wall biosynthesis
MQAPDFSVIITTRNRPSMFETALNSILIQKNVHLEVVVVNDGSSNDFLPEYKEMEQKYADNVKFVYLIESMNGHGQSYAINQGVSHAQGKFIALLDDDDYWTDEYHLDRCLRAFHEEDETFQVYCSLQAAWSKETKISEPIWLEKNIKALTQFPAQMPGIFYADTAAVLSDGAFAQVNTVVILRSYYHEIGGFDENLRYECDREFFLRAMDKTELILFTDRIVAKHNVPDPDKTDNMSTTIQELTKLQYQNTLYTKLLLTAKSTPVVHEAKMGHGYTLKHIAILLAKKHCYRQAFVFAGQALFSQFTLKWCGFCIYMSLRALFSRK